MPTPRFNRRLLLGTFAALGVVGATASAMAQATGFSPFTQAAFETALKGKDPVLVHVHAAWCPICRKQEAVFTTLAGEGNKDLATMKPFKLDFDTEKGFRKAYNVTSQSVIIVFRDGKEIARTGGITDKDKIAEFLNMALI